jgi:hypothetical protein
MKSLAIAGAALTLGIAVLALGIIIGAALAFGSALANAAAAGGGIGAGYSVGTGEARIGGGGVYWRRVRPRVLLAPLQRRHGRRADRRRGRSRTPGHPALPPVSARTWQR